MSIVAGIGTLHKYVTLKQCLSNSGGGVVVKVGLFDLGEHASLIRFFYCPRIKCKGTSTTLGGSE